eukprot:1359943-Amphidinium_carterae.1
MPIINPIRLGPAGAGGVGRQGSIRRKPVLLGEGIVAAQFVDVSGKTSKRLQRMPVARSTEIT